MDTLYFEITDSTVAVGVTVTVQTDGTLLFELNVLNDTGVIGDLNGLFFDLANDSIVDNLTLSGVDITGERIDANSVTKVSGYNNVNGEVANEAGKFDIGVEFGTQGIGADDVQATSFVLGTSDGSALSLDDVLNQDFAVRLTSVGDIDGERDGSVKIGGTAEPEVVDPPAPSNIAEDDSMIVLNFETFNAPDTDPLDGFVFSMFNNDTAGDGTTYQGTVTQVNGEEWAAGNTYIGSNGGLLIVNADGTVDFSANGEFDYLSGTETAETNFTYTIEGGDTASLSVEIIAFDPGGVDLIL